MVFGNNEFTIPDGLVTETFLIRPLSATDVELDYAAVMESKEFLRKWDQSSWPEDDFSCADNLEDLERHQRKHINRESFTCRCGLQPHGVQLPLWVVRFVRLQTAPTELPVPCRLHFGR